MERSAIVEMAYLWGCAPLARAAAATAVDISSEARLP
jgi:hypothetical protein